MGEITSCGADAQCAEVKRINVSVAFFLSIENQETGYLTHRTYKVAYGDLPNKPVPLTCIAGTAFSKRRAGNSDILRRASISDSAFFSRT